MSLYSCDDIIVSVLQRKGLELLVVIPYYGKPTYRSCSSRNSESFELLVMTEAQGFIDKVLRYMILWTPTRLITLGSTVHAPSSKV